MQNRYPKESWLSPKVEIRSSPIGGKGMFARNPIKAGETLVIWGGDYVSKEEAMKAKQQYNKVVMQLDDDLYTVEDQGDDITYFTNHSCDSNVWMKDAVTLTARRYIQTDEELTADYALWEADKNYIAAWQCACGSPLCRKQITGNDWRLLEVQKRYEGHFSPLINKLIRRPIC